MKKTSFIFAVLIYLPLTSYLQIIPNNNFSELEEIACPYDSTVTIQQPKHWRIYQTMDNKWDGVVDSSHCISVMDDGQNNALIDLGDIDPNKALFVRGLANFTSNQNLESDWIHSAYGRIDKPSDIQFKTSTNCPNNICSGLIIGIEIPDSDFSGTTTRFHYDIPDDIYLWGDFETCFATEYFEINRLKEFIFKFTLDTPSTILDGKLLKLQYSSLEQYFYYPPITGTIEATNFDPVNNSFFINMQDVGGTGWYDANFLFKYGDETIYPSSDNIYYIEARPQPNTSEQREVNIIVNEFNTVVFQPFTALRGALTEGSDTLRHIVNLVSNGSDVCMDQIIDFVFDDASKFIYNGGHINFEGKSACLMFKNKSALVVGENQTLYYGQNGKGILALLPGGEIILEKNSELIIDNTLWINGRIGEKYPPVFNVYLEPGNRLAFGENAYLINHFSEHPDTKLNVYMNGGILDDRKLNATSRSLINRIYPKPAERFLDNITIYQNPVASDLEFGFVADEPGILELELFDINGKLASIENYHIEQGHNKNTHQLDNLPAGIYALKLRSGQQYASIKIFKI